MNREEAFRILGIEATKDERALKGAYRGKLTVTNPEDDPEGFKRLRRAYEEACRYARETEDAEGDEQEPPRDTTPSGLWLERAVEIYGNIRSRQDNVSLEYADMDFGEQGISSISICGRTPLAKNTIHVRFVGEESLNQIVEFPHEEEYAVHRFELQPVKGLQKVVFVFLPGCDFDFSWFQFA